LGNYFCACALVSKTAQVESACSSVPLLAVIGSDDKVMFEVLLPRKQLDRAGGKRSRFSVDRNKKIDEALVICHFKKQILVWVEHRQRIATELILLNGRCYWQRASNTRVKVLSGRSYLDSFVAEHTYY
jgi:hypothetical protein